MSSAWNFCTRFSDLIKFGGETSGSVAKCELFSQANHYHNTAESFGGSEQMSICSQTASCCLELPTKAYLRITKSPEIFALDK